jgi:PAS domain S-box-containing protein
MASAPEDFFQQLADGAPVMIWMSGLDMGCFYFNRAWLTFRGRTLEQEFGNGWAEGVHPDDLQRCVNHYIRCFEKRIPFAMSYRLMNSNEEYRWILDRGVPHYLPGGGFIGFVGGCAELVSDSQVSRSADLGRHLTEMEDFARRIVTKDTGTGAPPIRPLQAVANEIQQRHLERVARKQTAASDMQKLAADMVSYADIPKGACIP